MNSVDLIKKMKKEWGVADMSKDDQKQYLNENVMPEILNALDGGNPILEITIVEELEQAMRECLDDIQYDETSKKMIVQAIGEEGLKAQTEALMVQAKRISIKPEKEVNMIFDGLDKVPTEQFGRVFIRVVTQEAVEAQLIFNWDNQIGLSESLKNTGIQFSKEQLKTAFLVCHALALQSRKGRETSRIQTSAMGR